MTIMLLVTACGSGPDDPFIDAPAPIYELREDAPPDAGSVGEQRPDIASGGASQVYADSSDSANVVLLECRIAGSEGGEPGTTESCVERCAAIELECVGSRLWKNWRECEDREVMQDEGDCSMGAGYLNDRAVRCVCEVE